MPELCVSKCYLPLHCCLNFTYLEQDDLVGKAWVGLKINNASEFQSSFCITWVIIFCTPSLHKEC